MVDSFISDEGDESIGGSFIGPSPALELDGSHFSVVSREDFFYYGQGPISNPKGFVLDVDEVIDGQFASLVLPFGALSA